MDYAIRVSHFVDPVTFELRRDVIVLIAGGHVAEVIEGGEVSGGLTGLAKHTLDLGDAACLPGFVNSHAHLDLSHLRGQMPSGLDFVDWISAMPAARRLPREIIDAGIDDACRMAVAAGTTALIDISVGGQSARAISRHGLRGIVALEVLHWRAEQAEAQMQRADDIVRATFELEHERLGADAGTAAAPLSLPGVDFGFSPHAPYTTSRELYQLAFGRAYGEGRVFTTHLGETREEEAFIKDGTGAIADAVRKGGWWSLDDYRGFGTSPIRLLLGDYLSPWLGEAPHNTVLVHCNYPTEIDLQLVAAIKPTICWCPRSHAYFEHDPWPLKLWQQTGARLVLGTDSLASNDGLDMWGEISAAARAHPAADKVELLRMATINGREAWNLTDDIADLAIWALPEGGREMDLAGLMNAWAKRHPPLLASFSQGHLIARSV